MDGTLLEDTLCYLRSVDAIRRRAMVAGMAEIVSYESWEAKSIRCTSLVQHKDTITMALSNPCTLNHYLSS